MPDAIAKDTIKIKAVSLKPRPVIDPPYASLDYEVAGRYRSRNVRASFQQAVL